MTPQDIEQASLAAIISGFNKQSLGMGRIMLRYLELNGEFSQEDAEEALQISEDTMKNIMNGKSLTVAQLAAVNTVAELTLQIADAVNKQQKTATIPEDIIGYG